MNYKHSRLVTWISTAERMPEPEQDKYILLIVDGRIEVGCYSPGSFSVATHMGGDCIPEKDVKYWMELPMMPKGETDEIASGRAGNVQAD